MTPTMNCLQNTLCCFALCALLCIACSKEKTRYTSDINGHQQYSSVLARLQFHYDQQFTDAKRRSYLDSIFSVITNLTSEVLTTNRVIAALGKPYQFNEAAFICCEMERYSRNWDAWSRDDRQLQRSLLERKQRDLRTRYDLITNHPSIVDVVKFDEIEYIRHKAVIYDFMLGNIGNTYDTNEFALLVDNARPYLCIRVISYSLGRGYYDSESINFSYTSNGIIDSVFTSFH